MSNETLTTYVVKGTTLRMGGKLFPPGKRIGLNAEDAERLKEFLEQPGEEPVGAEFELSRTSLQAELETLTEQIEGLRLLLEERDQTINSINQQLTAKTTEANQAMEQLNKINELNTEVEAARTRIAELEQQLVEATKDKTESGKPAGKGGKK